MKKRVALLVVLGALGCTGAGQSSSSCPAAAPLDCQDGKCCDSAYPYHCASTGHCWQTAAAAQSDCGSSFATCGGSTAGSGTDGGSSSGSTSGTGSNGGTSGGSMGACGTCSGQLECSQWIPGPSCNWQSCACYFTLNGSDTMKEYYHSSDGQCFQCSTTGTTCTSAAQALINHCGY